MQRQLPPIDEERRELAERLPATVLDAFARDVGMLPILSFDGKERYLTPAEYAQIMYPSYAPNDGLDIFYARLRRTLATPCDCAHCAPLAHKYFAIAVNLPPAPPRPEWEEDLDALAHKTDPEYGNGTLPLF